MNVGSITTEKRARNVALFGWFAQIMLALALWLMWFINGYASEALLGATLLMASGIPIWIVLIIIYHHRYKVAQEELESEELQREGAKSGAGAIFDADQEDWLVAKRRLDWLYRWVLPFFVLFVIATLFVDGIYMWGRTISVGLKNDIAWREMLLPTLSMFFIGGVALLAFLLSRYLLGMSREPEWRMLKSCSIYLFGNALACLAIVICLMLRTPIPLAPCILACAFSVLFLVLALEFVISLVLDFYRPRELDEGLRPAFESRLIGLVSEPGGIARTIADAVNYQFGFDVSSTWFYRMLEESVVRIIALAIIVLGVMTSFTVIDADEMAYVERWGEPLVDESTQQPRLFGPGLWIKAPWPMDVVHKANVSLVQQITIGEPKEEGSRHDADPEVITWTKKHGFVPSIDVLVATDAEDAGSQDAGLKEQGRAVAVSVLRISMPVQYRVKKDPQGFMNFIYNYENRATVEQMLRDVSYRELVKQAVSFDYDEVMSTERARVAAALEKNIQAECDRMQVGVDIVYVGLQEVHPPTESDVAKMFQAVATAQQQKETLIHQATIDYINALVETAGDQSLAERIFAFIEVKDLLSSGRREQAFAKIDEYLAAAPQRHQKLAAIRQRLAGPDDVAAAVDQLETHLADHMLGNVDVGVAPVRGLAGETLAIARSQALEKISQAAGKATNYELELAAFEASPDLYKMRKTLEVLSEELDAIRKYVVMVDPASTNVIIEMDERQGGIPNVFERSNQ